MHNPIPHGIEALRLAVSLLLLLSGFSKKGGGALCELGASRASV